MNLSVLVVDDHVIIRRGLRNLFREHYPQAELRESSSCADLLVQLRAKVPDLLMLDLQLSDGNAMDLLERIKAEHPAMHVLVYSMSPENLYGQRVLSMGGAGFLNKQSNEAEVLHAVRSVLKGRGYISHELQMRGLEAQAAQGGPPLGTDPFGALSERELRVAEELLKGAGVKEIADRLGLQPTTVGTYKARLFDKLGVDNILDLKRLWDLHHPSEGSDR